MTKQTWTAAVAATLFVALAALIAMTPIPFVAWAPGGAHDVLASPDGKPVIKISGAQTYPVSGTLRLTTVSVTRVDSALSLPEALLSYWLPNRDVLPRDSIYAPGKSPGDVKNEEAQMMDTSKSDAIVAALRAAKVPVREMPVVTAVSTAGPAMDKLKPGDLIDAVDHVTTQTSDEVGAAIRKHKVGDAVVFTVMRERRRIDVTVITESSNTNAGQPVVGISIDVGYSYAPVVGLDLDPRIGGPSAGLVFALGVYAKLTPGDLIAGRNIAGTGTISALGDVGAVGGLQEKIAGAQTTGATVFLVPAANCGDLAGVQTSMRIVRVETLRGAISALETLSKSPSSGQVPTCG